MTLYTETDLKRAIKRAYMGGMTPFSLSQVRAEILEKLTPIELPSDEEIDEESLKSDFEYTFRNGAKWMRDKIQGGNK